MFKMKYTYSKQAGIDAAILLVLFFRIMQYLKPIIKFLLELLGGKYCPQGGKGSCLERFHRKLADFANLRVAKRSFKLCEAK